MPARLSSPVSRIAAHRTRDDEIPPERHSDLVSHLAALPDPRDRRGLRHQLAGVLAVAVCAVLAGAAALNAWLTRSKRPTD